MSRHTYIIQWTNPETGEPEEAIESFEDTATVKAEDWAKDWAYGRADKGSFSIKEIVGMVVG